MQANSQEHKFKNALMVIPYRCAHCAVIVQVWNSRDGETSPHMPCVKCVSGVMHSKTSRFNRYFPRLPKVAEYVIVDMTMEQARCIARNFVDKNWSWVKNIYRYETFTRELVVEDKALEVFGTGHRPIAIHVNDYIERYLKNEQLA